MHWLIPILLSQNQSSSFVGEPPDASSELLATVKHMRTLQCATRESTETLWTSGSMSIARQLRQLVIVLGYLMAAVCRKVLRVLRPSTWIAEGHLQKL